MANSVPEFWNLVQQSRLLAPQQCEMLRREFQATNGATDHASPQALGEWLVSRNIFSRYQVTVLLAGRAGPFVYGEYKIYDRVEAGRLINEFRAVHGSTGHPVLLRFLTGPIVQDQRLWSAAATQAHTTCALVHPNFQRFFELVDLGSFKFLVGEDLHGETLAERLAVGRMQPIEACRVARLVAQGLSALHATGGAHGDVRPLNLWLEPPSPQYPGNVKLLRDPLLPPAPPNLTAEDPQGWLLAQSDYLAPEFQIPGKTPDVLTDLYALGCTLYHLLAGYPPFPGGSVMQKMARHAGEAIRPLEAYGVPQPVSQLVTFLMAKNPAIRYQDAQTVADQLAAFVDPGVVHLPSPPSMPTLPAYEAAIRQSQASLAARAVQSTFGVAPSPTTSEPIPAAPAIRPTDVPTGNVPMGKAVSPPAPTGAAASIRPAKEPVKVVDSTSNDPRIVAAKEARQRKKLIAILVGVGIAAIALIIGVNWMRGRSDTTANNPSNASNEQENAVVPDLEEQIGVQSTFNDAPEKLPPIKLPEKTPVDTKSPEETKTATKTPGSDTTTSAVDSGPSYDVVLDDGKLPWASPTSGKPIDLKYVPPLAGVFIVVRPADLLASPEGPKVLQALGPRFDAVKDEWEQAAGVKLEECEQVIVSLHDNDNQYPRVSVVVRLKDAIPIEDLKGKWGNPTLQKDEYGAYYTGAKWSYYAPAEEEGAVFLMAAAGDVKEVIQSPVPLLKREVEQVRRTTDGDRHITVLFDPTFLFSGEGDPLFTGDILRVKQPLQWLLGEGVQVGAASAHFDDSFYLELRVQSKVDARPGQVADDFRKRLEEVPDQLENYYADLSAPRYWSKLSNRFAGMLRMLHEQTRVGVEGNQAVVNAVLPGPAGHNLVLGTELTIATAPGQAVATAAAPSGPKTLEEAMNVKLKSFSFDNTSLEFAMRDLASAVQDDLKGSPLEFSIRIIGEDLQLDGITRNQSIRDFKQENKTVGDVLTALVMKANPITTVVNPNELDQKLVWVIGEDPDDKKKKVIVTTRAGAEKRGYKLPAPFQPK